MEFGSHGITVNAYAPGVIETPMMFGALPTEMRASFKANTPLKTFGVPTDIADFVSFIASKESKFITGQTISINGGLFFD
ncbi:short-chain dehydrogenase/reductase SDR [Roridomyces roridus]|uniref:Short-chain dehydrogenase/reductase SDR n=1 Tax=Roridomyces roridus TaxID=1738132 RepID=A0AAD7FFW3_9AGAR|nr:short-chain dehydrogenase/reductase SDR [Roridomyces roridus]